MNEWPFHYFFGRIVAGGLCPYAFSSLDSFADGRKIYSKKQTGRLPSADEVVSFTA